MSGDPTGEHVHPAAYEDVLSVAQAMVKADEPLVLVGDSAGATLVAAVSHTLRTQIAGQVLIYPYLGGDMGSGSYLTHADAPLLSRADMLFFEGIRCNGPAPKEDPSFAPLHDKDFSSLPQTAVFSAECDPLCDDGQIYCECIVAAGGAARWIKEAGLVHGYLRARHSVERARNSFMHMVDAVKSFTAIVE